MAEKKVEHESFHGGDALVRALHEEGVTHVFGIPGGEFITFLEALDRWGKDHGMYYTGVRHEQAAANMADAFSRVSGNIGVCCGTIGPGVADLIPGISPAWADNVPILIVHPQLDLKFEDHHRLQGGTDQLTLMRPFVKYQKSVSDPNRIILNTQKCFKELKNGCPGPVQLEIREDAFHAQVEDYGRVTLEPHQYRCVDPPAGNPNAIKKACELLSNAKKPIIVSGGGVTSSNGWEILQKLSLEFKIPTMTTVMGIGTISTDHETYIGATCNGSAPLKAAGEADVVLALGTKFSYTLAYGKPPIWNPNSKIIQIDIDPQMIGKNKPVEIGILGDCRVVLEQIYETLKGKNQGISVDGNWLLELKKARQTDIEMIKPKMTSSKTPIKPERLIAELENFMDPEDIICVDGGDIAVLTIANIDYIKARGPRTVVTSIGFGHLGTGIPYAIGAKLAKPDKRVFMITGDGSFLFNIQELDTAVRNKIPFVGIVADNNAWGMIKNAEKVKFRKRKPFYVDFEETDYVKMAQGFGCYAERVDDPDNIKAALQRAVDSNLPAIIVVPIKFVAPPGTKLIASFRALKF